MRIELIQRTSVYADMLLANVGDLLDKYVSLLRMMSALQSLMAKAETALTVLLPPAPPALDLPLDDNCPRHRGLPNDRAIPDRIGRLGWTRQSGYWVTGDKPS